MASLTPYYTIPVSNNFTIATEFQIANFKITFRPNEFALIFDSRKEFNKKIRSYLPNEFPEVIKEIIASYLPIKSTVKSETFPNLQKLLKLEFQAPISSSLELESMTVLAVKKQNAGRPAIEFDISEKNSQPDPNDHVSMHAEIFTLGYPILGKSKRHLYSFYKQINTLPVLLSSPSSDFQKGIGGNWLHHDLFFVPYQNNEPQIDKITVLHFITYCITSTMNTSTKSWIENNHQNFIRWMQERVDRHQYFIENKRIEWTSSPQCCSIL